MGAEPNAAGDLWLIASDDALSSDYHDEQIDWAASVRYWCWVRLEGFDGGAQITTFSLTIEHTLMDRPEFQALVAVVESAAFAAKTYPGRFL